MKQLLITLSIIRPINIAISLLSIIVVMQILMIFDLYQYILISTVISCYMSAGYILNDFLDIKIDAINKPNRVLVQKTISPYILIFTISSLFLLGSITAFFLPPLSTYIAVYIALPCIILYELFFKKIALIGNIIISILIGLVFIFTEAAVTQSIGVTYKIMILASLLNLIREIIKDMQDQVGDERYNFKTLPILIGVSHTIYILYFLSLVFVMVSCLLLYQSLSTYFLPLIFFTIHLPLLYINLGLTTNISSKECAKFSKILKLMIINGVLIILILS